MLEIQWCKNKTDKTLHPHGAYTTSRKSKIIVIHVPVLSTKQLGLLYCLFNPQIHSFVYYCSTNIPWKTTRGQVLGTWGNPNGCGCCPRGIYILVRFLFSAFLTGSCCSGNMSCYADLCPEAVVRKVRSRRGKTSSVWSQVSLTVGIRDALCPPWTAIPDRGVLQGALG